MILLPFKTQSRRRNFFCPGIQSVLGASWISGLWALLWMGRATVRVVRRAPPCRRSHDVDPSKHPCAVARAVSSQLAAHASSASDARFYFFLGYQAENGEASFNGRRGRDSVKAADLCRLCSDEPVAALQSNSEGPRRRPRQRGECVRGLMHQNPELGEKHRGSSPHILGLPPVRG